jgi:hypothetical protein
MAALDAAIHAFFRKVSNQRFFQKSPPRAARAKILIDF